MHVTFEMSVKLANGNVEGGLFEWGCEERRVGQLRLRTKISNIFHLIKEEKLAKETEKSEKKSSQL